MVFSIVAKGAGLAARTAAPRQVARTFSTSVVVKKDLVQEAYIRELKSYKAPAKAADAHKGQVREFQSPKAPQTPSAPSSSEMGSELDSFSKAEPDHAERAASGEAAPAEARQDVSAFLEEARKPVVDEHH